MPLENNTALAYELGDLSAYPVAPAARIYEGAAVAMDTATGFARPLQPGDVFAGFAIFQADNSTGNAGAEIQIWLKQRGAVVLEVAEVALADVGAPVYAADDDTFTLNVGSNSFVGFIARFISEGKALVKFDVLRNMLAQQNDPTGDAMLAHTTHLTAAQLKDLVANPQQILPAPGAGKANFPLFLQLNYPGGSTAYAGVTANPAYWAYDTGLYLGQLALADLLEQTNPKVSSYQETLFSNLDYSQAEDLPIIFGNDGGITDWTLGDGDLDLIIYYVTLTL